MMTETHDSQDPLEREYLQYLDYIALKTQSDPGAQKALELHPNLSPEEILHSFDILDEARAVVLRAGRPPLSAHLDLGKLLDHLGREGSVLSPTELILLKGEAQTSRDVKAFFEPMEEIAPLLYAQAMELGDYADFLREMEHSISPDGEILDSASPELMRVRQEASLAKKELSLKLVSLMRSQEFSSIVRDEIVTMRQDRFVIPVRAGAGKNRGLIHDWSQSGQTAYLEPLETVEDNNHLAYLKAKEKNEIERILYRLSALGRVAATSMEHSAKILTFMDLYLTLGRIAIEAHAIRPNYLPGAGLRILGLRHPLLEETLAAQKRKMTPLDFFIDPKAPLLVISGLNTGGKTVALKTLGLNLLLAKSGLFIHAKEDSQVDLPERILAVMGDSQDIASDLSTFSGHVLKLIEVLKEAGQGSLILLDELGGGTDPAEGAALALSVLEYLLQSGAWVLAATHFHLVKTWAALTPGVVSVAVNSKTDGSPAYGLAYGTPGLSGGLAMAGRLGLPQHLLERAKGYLDEGHQKSLELLEKLEEARGELIREKELLETERFSLVKSLSESKDLYAREVERLKRESKDRDIRMKMALSRYRLGFEELKDEVKKALKSGEKPNPVSIGVTRSKLEKEFLEARAIDIIPEEIVPAPQDLNIGDEVFIRKLKQYGTISSWNHQRGEGTVTSGKVVVKAKLVELGKGRKKKGVKSGAINISVSPRDNPFSTLNLLGRTVDEAIDEIDREIDRTILSGGETLTIIHGTGTGKLKSGILDFLRKHPKVLDFKSPLDAPGGQGVTEVHLDL
ncbi:MAG: Smr/MutS family protein [Deltaproteobacteria bacterium]|jgi:DNA mismatch repair protein MutS2|nr:Smr/MutS family protein [Deltaproteobacteria bacterium]